MGSLDGVCGAVADWVWLCEMRDLNPGFRVRNRNRFPVGLGVAEIAEFEFVKSVMHGRFSVFFFLRES